MKLIDRTEKPPTKVKWVFKIKQNDKIVRIPSSQTHSLQGARKLACLLFDISRKAQPDASTKVEAISEQADRILIPAPVVQSVWSSLYASKLLSR
ncbi:MAG: hypothetical protein MUP27_16270 [Desulfobacterales bacterium]|nr:hypothetical protein [Desulfobacterales bacterium]